MATRYICDTNVFYDFASNRLTLKNITGSDTSTAGIFYSPISVIELASKWDSKTWQDRKNAAKAILEMKAKELPDPTTQIVNHFGYKMPGKPFSFSTIVDAMAESKNEAGLRLKVDIDYFRQWREAAEAQWVADVQKVAINHFPKFAQWIATPATSRPTVVPKLRGEDKKLFMKFTKSGEWLASITVACHHRALISADSMSAIPSKKNMPELVKANDRLKCYAGVYTQSLIRLFTEGTLPQSNDSSDIEFFLYAADDNSVIVTSDKRWHRMACAAGFQKRVKNPSVA